MLVQRQHYSRMRNACSQTVRIKMLVQRQHYSRMRNACSPTVRRGGACYILEGVVILKAKRPVAASVSGSVTIKSIIHGDAPPDAWILGGDLILKCHNAFQWILTLP